MLKLSASRVNFFRLYPNGTTFSYTPLSTRPHPSNSIPSSSHCIFRTALAEMDLEDDFDLALPSEDTSTPHPERKLKRLKKSNPVADGFSKLKTLDLERLGATEETRSGSDDFDEETDWMSAPDRITSQENASNLGSKRALDFDSPSDESDEIGSGRGEEADNNQLSIDEFVQEDKKMNNKKKEKRAEHVGDDDMVISQRGGRQYLTQLRAESQRLLRETSDASFKPTPLVQKPVSSVLEKIRRRKLEVSRKFVSRTRYAVEEDDGYASDAGVETGPRDPSLEGRENEGVTCHVNLDSYHADRLRDTADHLVHNNISQQMDLDEESKQTFQLPIDEIQDVDEETKQMFRAPVDDTQYLFSDSQTSDTKDEPTDMTPGSPLEEVLAPSVLAMNLKLDSAPLDDTSTDEEEHDKENIPPESVDPSPVPNGDPAKAFVDDEAEEEDDSDNDLLRFQDDEEDDGSSEDSEELRDMIAAQFDEKQSDVEKRMELHQKLLDQQDAAKTNNIMFRCGLNNKEKPLLKEDGDMEEEEEEDDDDEDGADVEEDDFDEAAENRRVRISIKKLQEMIPQMFTDEDDVYVSSDDEEAERRLAKECLSEKAKDQAKLSSPAADARSSALFSHIKKVSHVPDNKRKAKPTLPDMLLMGGKGKTSSKPSFIGRGSNCSLPSSHKHGSNMMHSFIFEREESTIRSTISTAEDGPETIQRESQTSRSTGSAKFSNSQSRLSSQNRQQAEAETSSRTPLLELLRRSSLRSSCCTQDALVACNSSVFAAFKLEKKR